MTFRVTRRCRWSYSRIVRGSAWPALVPVEVLPLRRRVMKPFEPRPGHGAGG